MTLPSPWLLGAAFGLSEFGLSLLRRSKSNVDVKADQGSLRLIWGVILLCMIGSTTVWRFLPQAQLSTSPALYMTGLTVFGAGLLLRWYSIFYLGKYFTVDVAVAADQKVIDTGPYRFIRHPSYTGVLLEFLGFGLYMGNLVAILLLMVPVLFVFLRRIGIEEAVLQKALGENYTGYMRRTWRLIPFVY
jgi:protein-S-isoprenylcysteine O-methyltransferase